MSSTILQVELLIATALDLAQKAKSDPALAEKLLKDPTATISQKAGVPMPAGVTIKTKRAADGSIQLTPDAPASERTNMNKLIAYGELVRYARGLIAAARKDPKLAA